MTTLFKTLKAAAKVGGYAVRLFRRRKQIGILGGLTRDDAMQLQMRADYLGADEAELISNHPRGITLSPTGMKRNAGR